MEEGLHFDALHINRNDKDSNNKKDKRNLDGKASRSDINMKDDESSKSFSKYSSTENYDTDEVEVEEVDDNFPAMSSPSMVQTDNQRQFLILMLLAQVCAMHDSTPKTFTIHLLSLYEQGILDHDNSIGFLTKMGLVPKRLMSPPATVPSPSVIPTSQQSSHIEGRSRNGKKNAAALVPYNSSPHADLSTKTATTFTGDDKPDGIQTTRIAQVLAIRQHLESQGSSTDNKKNRKSNRTSTEYQPNSNFPAIQNAIDKPRPTYGQLKPSMTTTVESSPISSWAVEDHPLSVSRYSREFIQKSLLSFGSFGEVFLATNKLDNCDYAIKKIVFAAKGYDTKEVEIVINEVKCLAKLDHENVVRYYTSWLEPTWITGSNTSSPSNVARGGKRNQGGVEENIGISFPDEVAPKDIKKMLHSIKQLVYGDKHGADDRDLRISNQSETSLEPSILQDDFATSEHGHGKGLCAWSFSSNNDEEARSVDGNQPTSSDNDNKTISLGTLSTGGYGEDSNYSNYSDYSEWTNEKQQSSTGNLHVPNSHMYSHGQGHQQRKQEKSYRYEICLFIQMQLCNPSTLADWIRCRNKDNLTSNILTRHWSKHYEDAWKIFLQIVQGLAHVHSQGIIHRDLKPANIFYADNHYKIGDFGLSTMLKKLSSNIPTAAGGGGADFVAEDDNAVELNIKKEADNSTALTVARKHTQFGHDEWQDPLTAGVGTATYAAPEQIVSKFYGTKADIFSLGLILLELFCDFGSEHERAAIFNDCRRGKLPHWLVSTYPFNNIANLIISCTKPNPSDRPDAHEIMKLNIYAASLSESVVSKMKEKSTIRNGLDLELRWRDEVIAEQSRVIPEKSLTTVVAQTQKGTTMSDELRWRDEVIAEQSRLILEKDALLEKQTKSLKLMEDSLVQLTTKSDSTLK